MPVESGETPAVLQPFLGEISILLLLSPGGGLLRLEVIKDHDYPVTTDPHLRLDSKILLICE